MQLYREDQLGIDILTELSIGWSFTDYLRAYAYYIAFYPDGTTPVNVVNNYVFEEQRKAVVLRKDYTDCNTQVPLPIVVYDIISDTAEPIEIGTGNVRKIYTLGIMVHAENKAQLVNLGGFITSLLQSRETPILNYNVAGNPEIGVIYYEDIISSRMYDMLDGNIADVYTISISCNAIAEFNNSFLT